MTTETTTKTSDWQWITHHLAALAITGVLVIGSVYGVESIIARHDEANSTKWNSLLSQQAAQTKDLQQELVADEAQSAARDAQYQKTIQQLAQTIAQRNAQNAQQQKQDATLDAQQAAQRLATQTSAAAGEVTATNDSINIDLPIARRVVSNLDLLAVDEANLADTQKQLTEQKQLTVDAQTDAAGQKNLAVMYQDQLKTQTAACTAEIKTLKAKHRKNILKAFGIGFVTGFIAGHIW